MYTRTSTASRLAALVGASAVVVTAGAFPAAAATSGSDNGVQVVNTETVQAYTDATGAVKSKRIYEQLALTGKGAVDLANPITTSGLRNLDGFGGFKVKGNDQMVDVKVDGEKNLRSVSDYKGDLPLDISIVYKLDGKEISPKSLVGKSGDLEVVYTVKNVTGRTETISFTDGQGGTVEKEADVIVPMVGSLTTGLPSNFRDVKSGQANMAGDGEGGTKLSFTMTLLAPLGSDTAVFGYTAKVTDAIAPDSSVSALPVNPLESPSFKTAGDSYKGGAATGEELAAGAAKIDSNLLKLRDGAGDLLAGLIKLRNGAQQLSDGLNDEAAPGAVKLADGTGQLRDGTDDLQAGAGKLDAGAGQLDSGANDLNDGAGRLSGGLGDLQAGTGKLDAGATKLNDGAGRLSGGAAKAKAGAQDLTDGLAQISAGLKSLSGTDGLQAAGAGVAALQAGVNQVLAGFGTAGTAGTLIDGLTKLAAGIEALETGQTQLKGGLDQLVAPTGLPAAKGGVDQVKAGLDDALKAGGSLDQLLGGLDAVKTNFCTQIADPVQAATCQGTIDALSAGVNTSKTNLGAASAGLGQVSGGLTTAIGGLNTQLIPGAAQILAGLTSAKTGSNQALGGAQALKAGVGQVSGGLTQLATGITAAVDGALKLSTGADKAYAGSGQLNTGLGDLSAGADQLAAGTGELKAGTSDLSDGAVRLAAGGRLLKDGTGRLVAGTDKLVTGTGDLVDGAGKLGDGAGKLDDGANKLADGLSTAAGGSTQLADGLVQAAGGAPKIVDGAGRLSTEGTSKLVTAGEDTAQKYGEQYALLVAGAKRAQNEKMVVGAPADAAGLAAYSFEIQGEDGEGGRNLMRGVAGLALLGAGGAVFALRRRLI
jgi:putative membrane protein